MKGIIYKNISRFNDDRGDFTNISFEIKNKEVVFKRSYTINNNQKGVVRAFHGHKKECKLLFVPRGSFKIIVMDMETKEWKEYILSESVPKILFIPAGYYNGFVSLTNDSSIIIFSSSNMEESIKDDFRLPADCLGEDVWKIKNR